MELMNQIENTLSADFQQHVLLEMMKQQTSDGLTFPYSSIYSDQFFQQNCNENASAIQSVDLENEQNENEQIAMAFSYKKRVRTKFSQEQLDVLETTFQQSRYPTVDVVDNLVEQLDLPTQKITIWFQNRRARLKKNQKKLDQHNSVEKDDHQQYDSGIHLDEDVSHDSSRSPSANSLAQLPTLLPPPLPSSPFVTSPSPYYLPAPHQSFYSSMWPSFRYPLPAPYHPNIVDTTNMPYNLAPYNPSDMNSPFVFQNVSNYQYQRELNDEL